MAKPTINRERLQEIAEDGFLKHGESKELARIALAAMDSEPVEMPLDYLQGHKDGLEWASQLAEANHPETGDWLYDDPIELAKAIRKGPDMPPVQPVADSEPVAWTTGTYSQNAPLAFGKNSDGVEPCFIAKYWDLEMFDGNEQYLTEAIKNTCAKPLYRHAQQPVVPEGLIKAVEFYEQVKRENPPVETGAWKDAVDWVLKEACCAAMLNGGKP